MPSPIRRFIESRRQAAIRRTVREHLAPVSSALRGSFSVPVIVSSGAHAFATRPAISFWWHAENEEVQLHMMRAFEELVAHRPDGAYLSARISLELQRYANAA